MCDRYSFCLCFVCEIAFYVRFRLNSFYLIFHRRFFNYFFNSKIISFNFKCVLIEHKWNFFFYKNNYKKWLRRIKGSHHSNLRWIFELLNLILCFKYFFAFFSPVALLISCLHYTNNIRMICLGFCVAVLVQWKSTPRHGQVIINWSSIFTRWSQRYIVQINIRIYNIRFLYIKKEDGNKQLFRHTQNCSDVRCQLFDYCT